MFKLMDENAKRIKELRDKTLVNLKLDRFISEQRLRDNEARRYENIGKENLDIKVTNLTEDINKIQSDSTYIARNDAWISNVKKDLYLYKVLTILEKMSNKSH
jgi:hypothetical protein